MYVVASFKLNKNLERAIAELEYIGISRKKILALPLSSSLEQDIKTETYKKNLFVTAPILMTIFTLFGAIYGFVLHWGPVIWGLIGVVAGTCAGVIFDLFRTRKYRKNQMVEDGKLTDVFLLVHCFGEEQAAKAKDVILKWAPLGFTTFAKEPDGGER